MAALMDESVPAEEGAIESSKADQPAEPGARPLLGMSVGDGSGRLLTQDIKGEMWNGEHQRSNPALMVGKWIEVQGYGTGCVTNFNKVSRMDAIMMKNSTHTIRFSKSGRQMDLVISRYKSGELNKGLLWFFLYSEEQEQMTARRGSMGGK